MTKTPVMSRFPPCRSNHSAHTHCRSEDHAGHSIQAVPDRSVGRDDRYDDRDRDGGMRPAIYVFVALCRLLVREPAVTVDGLISTRRGRVSTIDNSLRHLSPSPVEQCSGEGTPSIPTAGRLRLELGTAPRPRGLSNSQARGASNALALRLAAVGAAASCAGRGRVLHRGMRCSPPRTRESSRWRSTIQELDQALSHAPFVLGRRSPSSTKGFTSWMTDSPRSMHTGPESVRGGGRSQPTESES